MRGKRIRGAAIALTVVALMLAAAGSAAAVVSETLTTRSISAGDGSLTIAVSSTGNSGSVHGNASYWTSPVDASGSFEWFSKPVSIIDFAFPDVGNGVPVFSAATYARNTGAGYGADTPLPAPYTLENDGVYSITATGTDDVGDVTGAITPAFGLDQVEPVVTTDKLPFYAGAPTVTLTATDTMSGVENVLVKTDANVNFTSYEPDPADPGNFSVGFPFAGEGMHMYAWVAFDNAGNVNHGHEMFVIDNTAPTTTSDLAATYNGPATIKLTATDNTDGSGVAHTFYRLDGAAPVEGTTINVPAPASGATAHSIEFWSEDAVGNVETPHATGNFLVKSQFSIAVTQASGGSISPTGTALVPVGSSSATYTITPNTGYHTVKVLVDGVDVGAVKTYKFTGVNANHTLTAVFAINTYKITPSRSNTHGWISPHTVQTVNYGSSKKFTITVSPGYKIQKVVVDGTSVGVKTSYTFSNVKANHTIKAYFVLK